MFHHLIVFQCKYQAHDMYKSIIIRKNPSQTMSIQFLFCLILPYTINTSPKSGSKCHF